MSFNIVTFTRHNVALIRQNNNKNALDKLIKSVTMMPYNWSAWQEIFTS